MESVIKDNKFEGELLDIVTYPDPVLTQTAKEVEIFDEHLKLLCKNMIYTMYHAPGIGLAAPQVGLSRRIFVVE